MKNNINIFEVLDNKLNYIDLLLIGDEDINMIMKYIEKSNLYVLKLEEVIGLIALCEYDEDTIEIKNLAIKKEYQNLGYGKMLIDFIEKTFRNKYNFIILGTGDSPLTIPFYTKLGFKRYEIIENYFLENYNHEIIENDVLLKDLIILKKKIGKI